MNSVLRSKTAADLTVHRRPLHALTGIRLFAAVYVVIYHAKLASRLFVHPSIAFVGRFFMSGYLAVAMFFLLSGFILAYTYAGQISKPGGYRRFWEARFARLWPVYTASLLLTSLIKLSLPKPYHVVATLLMVQAWNPFNPGLAWAWNYVCWTLSVEAFFYLCFPWYQELTEKLRSQGQVGILVLMLGVCVYWNSGAHGLGYEGPIDKLPLPVIRLPEFLAGVALGNLFLRKTREQETKSSSTLRIPHGSWTYISAVLGCVFLCRSPDSWTSLALIIFSAFVFGLASERTLFSRCLSTRPMLFGGGISYSIYLMQTSTKLVAKDIADNLHMASPAFEVVVMGALLFGVSTLLSVYVEGPARLLLRSIFARLECRRTFKKRCKLPIA